MYCTDYTSTRAADDSQHQAQARNTRSHAISNGGWDEDDPFVSNWEGEDKGQEKTSRKTNPKDSHFSRRAKLGPTWYLPDEDADQEEEEPREGNAKNSRFSRRAKVGPSWYSREEDEIAERVKGVSMKKARGKVKGPEQGPKRPATNVGHQPVRSFRANKLDGSVYRTASHQRAKQTRLKATRSSPFIVTWDYDADQVSDHSLGRSVVHKVEHKLDQKDKHADEHMNEHADEQTGSQNVMDGEPQGPTDPEEGSFSLNQFLPALFSAGAMGACKLLWAYYGDQY